MGRKGLLRSGADSWGAGAARSGMRIAYPCVATGVCEDGGSTDARRAHRSGAGQMANQMPKLPLILAALTAGVVTVAAMAAPAVAVSSEALPTASPAPLQSRDGLNRRLRIHNQTGWTMVRFQAAEGRSRAWQADALGPQPVASGASWVAVIDDGAGACVYGLRAEFSNGQTLEREAINVCNIADYYFTR